MSEATKHTPGPWEVRHDGETVGRMTDEPQSAFGKRGFITIAHLYAIPVSTRGVRPGAWGSLGKEGMAANARLIAAAPDLLEALRSFGVLACTPEWEAKRQAAIKKATTL